MEILLFLLLWSALGCVIGRGRERAGLGCLLGFVLGPLGCILVLLADGRPKCPFCGGRINSGAAVCCHCGRFRSEIYQYQQPPSTPVSEKHMPQKIVIRERPINSRPEARDVAPRKHIKIIIKK